MAKPKNATFAPTVATRPIRATSKDIARAMADDRARTHDEQPSLFVRDSARVNRRLMRLSTSRRKAQPRNQRNRDALLAQHY